MPFFNVSYFIAVTDSTGSVPHASQVMGSVKLNEPDKGPCLWRGLQFKDPRCFTPDDYYERPVDEGLVVAISGAVPTTGKKASATHIAMHPGAMHTTCTQYNGEPWKWEDMQQLLYQMWVTPGEADTILEKADSQATAAAASSAGADADQRRQADIRAARVYATTAAQIADNAHHWFATRIVYHTEVPVAAPYHADFLKKCVNILYQKAHASGHNYDRADKVVHKIMNHLSPVLTCATEDYDVVIRTIKDLDLKTLQSEHTPAEHADCLKKCVNILYQKAHASGHNYDQADKVAHKIMNNLSPILACATEGYDVVMRMVKDLDLKAPQSEHTPAEPETADQRHMAQTPTTEDHGKPMLSINTRDSSSIAATCRQTLVDQFSAEPCSHLTPAPMDAHAATHSFNGIPVIFLPASGHCAKPTSPATSKNFSFAGTPLIFCIVFAPCANPASTEAMADCAQKAQNLATRQASKHLDWLVGQGYTVTRFEPTTAHGDEGISVAPAPVGAAASASGAGTDTVTSGLSIDDDGHQQTMQGALAQVLSRHGQCTAASSAAASAESSPP